jgi:hypothetical protein
MSSEAPARSTARPVQDLIGMAGNYHLRGRSGRPIPGAAGRRRDDAEKSGRNHRCQYTFRREVIRKLRCWGNPVLPAA